MLWFLGFVVFLFGIIDNPPITPENAMGIDVLHSLQIARSYAMEIAFNPVENSQLAVAQADGFVSLWDADTGEQITNWRASEGAVNSLAYASNGERLITAGNDGIVTAWDVATQTSAWTIRNEAHIPLMLDTAANDTVAVAYNNGTVSVWNTDTGGYFFTVYGYSLPIVALDLSISGSDLAIGYGGNVLLYTIEDVYAEDIYLWDVIPVEELDDLEFHPNPETPFFASPTVLLTAGDFSVPQIWDLLSSHPPRPSQDIGPQMAYPYKVAFSSDGSMFALAGALDFGECVSVGLDCPIRLIAVSPDQAELYRSGDVLSVLPANSNNTMITDIAFSNDDRFFASTTIEGSLTIWGIPQYIKYN